VLAIAAALCAWHAGITAAQERDPLAEIAAKELPAFRKLLSDDTYVERSRQELAALGDLEELRSSAMPAFGAKVVRVDPGGAGERLGVAQGHILVRMNDKPVRWSEFGGNVRLPGTLEFYDLETKSLRKLRFGPGSMGLAFSPVWRPEFAYLHRGPRQAKLDEHVVVGIVMRSRDPDLAETAWHRAVAAGYRPDFLSAQCGAEIALNQGRSEDSWQFALAAQRASTSPDETVSPVVLYRAAMANFQLRAAREVARQYPRTINTATETLTRLIDEYEARSNAQRLLPPPSEMAQGMYRDDLTPRLAVGDRTRFEGLFMDLQNGETVRLRPATDQYMQFVLFTPEAVGDFDFSVRLSLKVSDDREGRFPKFLQMGVFPGGPDDSDPSDRLTFGGLHGLLELQFNGVEPLMAVQHSEEATRYSFTYQQLRMDGRHEHALRLVRVQGRGEMFLDGKRLAYVPLGLDPQPLAFVIKAVGMSVDLNSTEIVELVEKTSP
jgi:hypothetical protein